MRRRTLFGTGLAALVGASRAAARNLAALYFPAGCRLGFRKPEELRAVPIDRNLLARNLRVTIDEPLVTGGSRDREIWARANYDDAKLLREERISAREERRFFERTNFAGNPDISWHTLVVKVADTSGDTEWFGQLDFQTSGADGRVLSRGVMDDVVGSVAVRPALSVVEMLAEHGIVMNLAGLHPYHFGNRLSVGLREPRTLAERWTNDAYISMPNPPALYLEPGDDPANRRRREEAVNQARKLFEARVPKGQVLDWTSNGIVWFAEEAMRPLIGTTLSRGLEGYGASRIISLTAFCKSKDMDEMNAATERLARSVVLDP